MITSDDTTPTGAWQSLVKECFNLQKNHIAIAQQSDSKGHKFYFERPWTLVDFDLQGKLNAAKLTTSCIGK